VPVLTAVLGIAILLIVLWDGFETMVLPRRVTRKVRLTRLFYRTAWRLWSGIGRRMAQGKRRDAYLSIFGPLSLFLLFLLWGISLLVSFGLLFYAAGAGSFLSCLYMSGSSFFTLGSATPRTGLEKIITIAEGGLGMGFLALVISYLPVMYQSFSRREAVISLLDARGGSPAAALELLRRHGHGQGMDCLPELLRSWEHWAAELLESHVSYPVLVYFRSQHDNQSWLAALTTILDTCTLVIQSTGGETGWQAQLTFAMARHAVVDLAQILRIEPRAPHPDRLPPADCQHLQKTLAKAGIDMTHDSAAAEKIAELRAMYEPFVNSMADYLLLRLPPWLHSGRVDNWRTSAWGRISIHTSVLPLADLGDEEHR
jgi:ion channel